MYQPKKTGKQRICRYLGEFRRLKLNGQKRNARLLYGGVHFARWETEGDSRTKLVGHEPVELKGLSGGGCVVDLNDGSDRLHSDILHFCPWPIFDGGSALETVGLGL